MLYSTLAVALCGLSWSAAAASNQKPKPECVDKCWTNTQYVSSCMGDHQCLCEDTEFQNAVYQCLYSQCSTSKFGTALHHTLQQCQHDGQDLIADDDDYTGIDLEREGGGSNAVPTIPTIRLMDQGLKRRNAGPNVYPTGRARPAKITRSASVTRSATRSVTRSVRPTRSVTRSGSVTRSVTRSARTTRTATRSVTRSGSVTRSRTRSVTRSATRSRSVTRTRSVTRSASQTRRMRVITQIADGQIQAPTGTTTPSVVTPTAVITQIGDGQIQAPNKRDTPGHREI